MQAESAAAGPEVVYRWDLDKTYVQTEFSTVRGLLRAALESAQNKRAVPGMRALLTALSRRHDARIVVVSGSPTFMRPRIEEMFRLHGVRCDRLVLKDFGAAIARGRLGNIKAQLAYKLHAHLQTRLWLSGHGAEAPEVCFGDDAEVDALIYCLYADVCARRVDATRLRALLEGTGAYDDEVADILRALAQLPRVDPVRRVFIHLDTRSPPARYRAYQGRVTATFNAFQIALSLAADGLADDAVVRAVADDLVDAHRVDGLGLAGSLEDAARRGVCDGATARHVAAEVLPRSAAASVGFGVDLADQVVRRLSDRDNPSQREPEPLPYEALFVAEENFAHARKLARKAAARISDFAAFIDPNR